MGVAVRTSGNGSDRIRTAAGILVFSTCICGLIVVLVAIKVAVSAIGFPLLLVLVPAYLCILFGGILYVRWARRAVLRWADREGWSAVGSRPWPWTPTAPGVTEPVVKLALVGAVDGSRVTVGVVSWAPSGMLDVAGPAKGSGLFAIVDLAQSYPRLGVRRRTNISRKQPGQDEFDRLHWTICTDAETAIRHVGSEIKHAHLTEKLPEWMITGDQLYVVDRSSQILTPRRARSLARQVIHIADLTRIEPAATPASS